MARFAVYGTITLAALTVLWVGLRRAAWDAAYRTVGIVVPAQELDSSLGDDELRDDLRRLHAHGVVAVSVELTDLPQWGLQRTSFDHDLWRVIQLARAVGLGMAVVADPQHTEIPAELRALRPEFLVIVSDPPGDPIQLADMPADTLLGIVEFSEPSGLYELYRRGWRNFVRVHAIPSRELDRLGLEGALARWARAVHERSIRLLWVTEHRRFPNYIERLGQRVAHLGMELGEPSAPQPFESSYFIYLAIGAGWVSFFVSVALGATQSLALALGMGALIGGGLWDLELARPALAIFMASFSPWVLLRWCAERTSGWKLVIVASLGSLGVGLGIAALLSDLAYFLKLTEFRGVKVALVAPTLGVVGAELWRWRKLGWGLLRAPLRAGAWLLCAVGAGALFFVLERSGNIPIIPVARWEELLRERLEEWFIARPRFKEFFVGHPALVLWKNEVSLSQLGLLALGALGQASIVNTFAHLHTPLVLSLWRTLNGLALGLGVGIALRRVLIWGQQWRLHRAL